MSLLRLDVRTDFLYSKFCHLLCKRDNFLRNSELVENEKIMLSPPVYTETSA